MGKAHPGLGPLQRHQPKMHQQPNRRWEEGMVGRGQREQNPQTPSNFRSPLKSGKGLEGPRNSSFMVHLDPPLVRKRKLFNTTFPIQHRKVQQASTGMQHEYQHREDWGSGEFVPCHKEREWCGIITNSPNPSFHLPACPPGNGRLCNRS